MPHTTTIELPAEPQALPPKPDRRRNAGEATREKLIAAAEPLFADLGYEGASTRTLASAAGVDLAMIVYHFGSKLGLYREILLRRAERLNAARLAELDEVLERSGNRPELAQVVHALVATNIRLRNDPELGGLPVARLIAHQLLDPNDSVRHLIGDMFDQLAQRFLAAIRLALPAADEPSVFWSFHFAISAMVQTMANVDRIEQLSRGQCDMKDDEHVIDRLVCFIVGGIQATAACKVAAPRKRAPTRAGAQSLTQTAPRRRARSSAKPPGDKP